MMKTTPLAIAILLLCACKPSTPVESAAPASGAPQATEATASTDQAVAPTASLEPATPVSVTAPVNAEPTASAEADKAISDSIDNVLGDHVQYQSVITQLQQAVTDKDAAAVAALVDYPFTATIDGKKRAIKDAGAFVAQYDKIVTPRIADAIINQKYADLMVSYRGVMFGSGEVWLNGICKDKACKASDVKVVTIQAGAH